MSGELPLRLVRQPFQRRLIDISPPLSPQTDVWPGDTKLSIRRVMDMGAGASCNVTTITTTVQIGAHADAPLHFSADGEDAASVELRPYVGPARLVRAPRRTAVTREDVEAIDLAGVERLLLCTRSEGSRARFRDGFAWLEPEAARVLASAGLRLFGIDSFSVDHPDSKTLESHHALRAGGCVILEGLELSAVTPGDYELMALPLRLVGCDASPVRAVLRELPPPPVPRKGLPSGVRRRAASKGPADSSLDLIADRIPASIDGELMQLNCLHSSVHLKQGDKVRITVDSPANVLLLDDKDFDAYAEGRPYHYYGGWVTKSPVELSAPSDGRWNLVIDSGDDAAKGVGAKVEILR